MQRYLLNDKTAIVNLELSRIVIISDDAHHIKNVMRMNIKDEIIACYQEKSYLCEIEEISNKEVCLNIVNEISEMSELPCSVTIAQGLVRREKMEEVIDHITELGADFYLPVIMKRSTVKMVEDKLDNRLTRLNRIAKEAAEQSHRIKKLDVLAPITFNQFIQMSKLYDLCLVAHVDKENNLYIGDAIKNESKILILVGPEGGIDQSELSLLELAGFKQVSLGKRVLRTEVAPSYIMSIIDNIRGNNHEI